jgi:hypothetical protein
MANIYQPEEKLFAELGLSSAAQCSFFPKEHKLVLDLTTVEGRIAAYTYAYVLYGSKDTETRKQAEALLKELDQWDK